jgi:hypothetical protein
LSLADQGRERTAQEVRRKMRRMKVVGFMVGTIGN